MKMVRWDPFRELEDMSTRLNRFFSRTEPALPAERAKEGFTFADWVPLVDIRETPEEYIVEAELPKLKKEEIKVGVKDNVLTIEGERKLEKEEKGKKMHRIERAYGSFFRSFTLPEGIDEKKLLASYKDGLLEIHLPKAPVAKPREIEVKVG